MKKKSILSSLFLGLLILGMIWFLYGGEDFKSYSEIKSNYKSSEMLLLDANGELLHQWRVNSKERVFPWVELKNISPAMMKAVLKSEDRNFLNHRGVDLKALMASCYQKIFKGSSRGGSTISMQVAKLIGSRRSSFDGIIGKLRQIQAAYKLEKSWNKSHLLETYLNLISFRGEYRGLNSSSWNLLSKAPSGITSKEATLMAVLLRSPNATLEAWQRRACQQEPQECESFKEFFLHQGKSPSVKAPSLALHLAQRLASQGQVGEVHTSLRKDIQLYVQDVVSSQVKNLELQNVQDAAVLVVENSTGEVYAYVGGAGLSEKHKYVDGVQSFRQAGSTLKPFLYATAFERNILREDSWIEDSPIDIVFDRGVYKPQNHDRKFYGWVQAKTALGSSLNVPAVKVFKLLNDESFWTKLKDLNFKRLQSPEHYGPALALGVTDVTLEDLTQAYRTLARGGSFQSLRFDTTSELTPAGNQIFKPEAASSIRQILSDSQNRSLSFGLDSVLNISGVAVKTGTSKDMRDNWCLGYNSRFTVGVWVGNFSGSPMWNVMGISGAAPIWNQVMRKLEEVYPSKTPSPEFKIAQNIAVTPQSFPKAKIIYPENGLVLALDPAIPSDRQKLPLIADQAGQNKLSWKINGVLISQTGETFLWPPSLGRHKIELMKDKESLESVEVIVR